MRLLLPFAAGIGIGISIPVDVAFPFWSYLLFAAAAFPGRLSLKYRRAWVYALMINACLLAAGFVIAVSNTSILAQDHFSRKAKEATLVYVVAGEQALEKNKSYKLKAEVKAIKVNDQWQPVSGKAMFYFRKDSLSSAIRYGDALLIQARFSDVPPPQNPEEFNYKGYLADHGIYHQAFIKSDDWITTGRNEGNTIVRLAKQLRETLLTILQQNGLKGDEYAVTAALMLGYSDKLDADILSAYASTGALHVLSVSGLHVGIVYIVFNFLLSFLGKRKYGNYIRAGLLLLLLWFYAFLTGLSPSVLRSAAMFSFLAAARAFDHPAGMFNTLAVSALILLAIDPFLLKDVGFQLSYIAVGGILYLHPIISSLWEPSSVWLGRLWELSSVSLAAQVATFPLGLFYFHQFPNYFLIANLLVIPLSALLTYAGMALLLFWKIPGLSWLLAKVLGLLAWLLNACVRSIEGFPYAVTDGVYLDIISTCLLYSALLSFVLYLSVPHKPRLYACLLMLVLLAGFKAIHLDAELRQKELVVYNINGHTAVELTIGKSTILFADSALLADKAKMNYHIRGRWTRKGISNTKLREMKESLLSFNERKILILSGNRDPSKCDPQTITSSKLLVLDSSVPRWLEKKWIKLCEEKRMKYYSVRNSGALVLSL